MRFKIDEQYLCSVTIKTEHDFIKDRNNPTNEDIIKILKGNDKAYSISSKDHDEFTKLRLQLEELGYIKVERGWCNGDTVLKPFYLNGWKFKKNQMFPCAPALKCSIECAKKYKWKTLA